MTRDELESLGCTQRQIDAYLLYLEGMSQREIAKHLGVTIKSVWQRLQAVKKKQVAQHPNKPGFTVDKVSELIDNRTGESLLTWHKSSRDREDFEESVDNLIGLVRDNLPPVKAIESPEGPHRSDLHTSFLLGDPHINMLAWAKETKQDWDLNIAIEHHEKALDDLLSRSPDSETASLVTLGDLFHNDSLKAITPGSGNIVDVDGRMMKAWEIAVLMIERMICRMLTRFRQVYYICVPGNHSETLERALCSTMAHIFRDEKRVTVLDNTPKHIPFTFGRNFLLYTHGDRLSKQKKADIAVSLFRDLHGKAKYTHVCTGHLHHAAKEEVSGCQVEIFPVLCPPDAWHYESGYITSDQAATQVTYHIEGGEYSRMTTNPRIFLEQ